MQVEHPHTRFHIYAEGWGNGLMGKIMPNEIMPNDPTPNDITPNDI